MNINAAIKSVSLPPWSFRLPLLPSTDLVVGSRAGSPTAHCHGWRMPACSGPPGRSAAGPWLTGPGGCGLAIDTTAFSPCT